MEEENGLKWCGKLRSWKTFFVNVRDACTIEVKDEEDTIEELPEL